MITLRYHRHDLVRVKIVTEQAPITLESTNRATVCTPESSTCFRFFVVGDLFCMGG